WANLRGFNSQNTQSEENQTPAYQSALKPQTAEDLAENIQTWGQGIQLEDIPEETEPPEQKSTMSSETLTYISGTGNPKPPNPPRGNTNPAPREYPCDKTPFIQPVFSVGPPPRPRSAPPSASAAGRSEPHMTNPNPRPPPPAAQNQPNNTSAGPNVSPTGPPPTQQQPQPQPYTQWNARENPPHLPLQGFQEEPRNSPNAPYQDQPGYATGAQGGLGGRPHQGAEPNRGEAPNGGYFSRGPQNGGGDTPMGEEDHQMGEEGPRMAGEGVDHWEVGPQEVTKMGEDP
ncbi:hypothetical protein DXG01_003357, partial [Tephrocybe rancida]